MGLTGGNLNSHLTYLPYVLCKSIVQSISSFVVPQVYFFFLSSTVYPFLLSLDPSRSFVSLPHLSSTVQPAVNPRTSSPSWYRHGFFYYCTDSCKPSIGCRLYAEDRCCMDIAVSSLDASFNGPRRIIDFFSPHKLIFSIFNAEQRRQNFNRRLGKTSREHVVSLAPGISG